MFPFSIRKSFIITNHIEKAHFVQALTGKLSLKLHNPSIATIADGYELVFNRGFVEVLIRLNWISDGIIRITHTKEHARVSYELSFMLMFWFFCFITLAFVISIITNYFSLRVDSIVPQLTGIGITWVAYVCIVYLTTVIFDLRIGKTINEVELSQENISAKQLSWMNKSDTCPACGYVLEKSDAVCPDCGLRL